MSNEVTATVSSPENFSGRARSAHSTSRPAATWAPDAVLQGVGRHPVVDLGLRDGRPQLALGPLRDPPVRGVDRRRCVDVGGGGRGHPHLGPDHPGVEHVAVDGQGGDPLGPAQVGDVVHRQDRALTGPPRPRLGVVGRSAAEHQQAVTGEEDVAGRGLGKSLPELHPVAVGADQVHPRLRHGHDALAVGLDQVGLVDAGLLDVRGRVRGRLSAPGGRAGVAGGLRRRAHRPAAALREVAAARPLDQVVGRLVLEVLQHAGAGPERLQRPGPGVRGARQAERSGRSAVQRQRDR